MMEMIVHGLRWVNIGLGLLNLIWLLMWMSHSWQSMNTTSRAAAMAIVGFCIAVVYGTAETIALDTRIGFRSFMVLFANLNLLYVLMMVRKVKDS